MNLSPGSLVLLACLVGVTVAAAQPGGADEALLQGHLAQAAALAPSASQPGFDTVRHALQAEVTAKQRTWAAILAKDVDTEALLTGVPRHTLDQAKRVASDTAAVQAVLKAGGTLPLLLALTAWRNAEVRSASQHWRATLQRFEQAAYLEELLAQYRGFVRELDTQVGPQIHKDMPAKTFPFPAVLALKGEVIDLEATIAKLGYQQTLRKVLNETARTFFDLQFATQALTITRANRDLVAQMEAITRGQLQVGGAKHVDVLKAQTLLARLENNIRTYERQRHNAMAQVNALLAVPPQTPWGVWSDVGLQDQTLNIDEALQRVRAESQELQKAARDVELMLTMVRMAETMLYPRASVGSSQIALSLGAEAGPTRTAMAAFPTLPTVSTEAAGFGANAAYLDELRLRVQQARALLDEATARTAWLMQDAHYRADVSRRETHTLAEAIVPRAKQAFDATREQYAAGRVPFNDFFEASQAHIEAALRREEARRDLYKALADVQDAMGRTVAPLLVGLTK